MRAGFFVGGIFDFDSYLLVFLERIIFKENLNYYEYRRTFTLNVTLNDILFCQFS